MHVTAYGRGIDLVLLHGWGTHGGVMAELACALGAYGRVHVPDLPGHGHGSATFAFEANTVVAELQASLPAGAVWIGWSLGALLAAMAVGPARARGLVMMAGLPRFLRAADWPGGADPGAFAPVRHALQDSPRAGLDALLRLLSVPGAAGRRVRRLVQEQLSARPLACADTLIGALDVLEHADARDCLRAFHGPALFLGGDSDPLVLPRGLQDSATLVADSHIGIITGAGHAPFLSHPEQVMEFVHGHIDRCHQQEPLP